MIPLLYDLACSAPLSSYKYLKASPFNLMMGTVVNLLQPRACVNEYGFMRVFLWVYACTG